MAACIEKSPDRANTTPAADKVCPRKGLVEVLKSGFSSIYILVAGSGLGDLLELKLDLKYNNEL